VVHWINMLWKVNNDSYNDDEDDDDDDYHDGYDGWGVDNIFYLLMCLLHNLQTNYKHIWAKKVT
jgi:hypothetical protein